MSTKIFEKSSVDYAEISSLEEAQIVVNLLDYHIKESGNWYTLSAPEVSVQKKVAIIRHPSLKLNLVNPTILHKSSPVISFNESCCGKDKLYNCLRFNNITIQLGLLKEIKQFSGINAFLIQHAMDHLEEKSCLDRTVKMAVVRENGEIRDYDWCPCASRERFIECCRKSI